MSSCNSWRTTASRYCVVIGRTPCSRGDVIPQADVVRRFNWLTMLEVVKPGCLFRQSPRSSVMPLFSNCYKS